MPVSKSTSPPRKTHDLTPYWKSDCGRAAVYVGDCREVMAQMEPNQFHAVVTDPPYGLEFMGREWDAPWKNDGVVETCSGGMDESRPERDGTQRVRYRHDSYLYQKWFQQRAVEMLRVAKPGAHLLSFGGTRMWHRMACAVEDAGWDVRDTIMWVYSQGFPKSRDISKDIDKKLGAEREKVRHRPRPETSGTFSGAADSRPWIERSREAGYHEIDGDEPITDAAKHWYGWGTTLKPSVEPVVLARRPFDGTVAECVMHNCTGAINVGGCLVGTEGGTKSAPGSMPGYKNNVYGAGMGGNQSDPGYVAGRWPANLIHDGSDDVVRLFPQTTSSSAVMPLPRTPGDSVGSKHGNSDHAPTRRGHDDSGSAARFFYTAKAGSSDRPHGKGATIHPTVKPLDLMRYLVRLVCVRGGTVLDPFMGSGSTGCAAVLDGMRFVGVEQSEEYADLAVGRLKLALAERGPENMSGVPSQVVNTVVVSPPPSRRMRGT